MSSSYTPFYFEFKIQTGFGIPAGRLGFAIYIVDLEKCEATSKCRAAANFQICSFFLGIFPENFQISKKRIMWIWRNVVSL